MKNNKQVFRCKHCKTIYFYPKNCEIDEYCEFCRARGKKRKIIEINEDLKK